MAIPSGALLAICAFFFPMAMLIGFFFLLTSTPLVALMLLGVYLLRERKLYGILITAPLAILLASALLFYWDFRGIGAVAMHIAGMLLLAVAGIAL
jgi:hypothetical protein